MGDHRGGESRVDWGHWIDGENPLGDPRVGCVAGERPQCLITHPPTKSPGGFQAAIDA